MAGLSRLSDSAMASIGAAITDIAMPASMMMESFMIGGEIERRKLCVSN